MSAIAEALEIIAVIRALDGEKMRHSYARLSMTEPSFRTLIFTFNRMAA